MNTSVRKNTKCFRLCCFSSNEPKNQNKTQNILVAWRVNSNAAFCSEDTLYLVPTHPVTLPLHPPPILQIPQLMYLKRQRYFVPKETTVNGTDSALSLGRHNAREHRVSCQRRRQPISLSYLLIVTSLSLLMAGFLGLISETIVESCRDIIMSLQGCCFF